MNEEKAKAASSRRFLSAGIFGLALGGLVPVSAFDGAAMAQDAGDLQAAGTYLRLELGAAQPDAGDASWLPPGPSDPRVYFDLDLDTAATGAIAIGRSFGEGWRGEVAVNSFGKSDFSGDWSYTVPADPGPHASMQGSVRSVAFFANGYYDIAMEGDFTPFVTAGLGVADNTMGEWTRTNPDAGRVTRSFAEGSDSGFAWNIGAGVAWDVGSVAGSGPAKLELAWRYYDLGSVSGSAQPLDGSGSSTPREPLNFDVTNQVFSVGLRFPL
jgi:opacity protein-like surface antigen